MRALLVVNPKATMTTPRSRDVLAHALASVTRLEVRESKARGHATELAAGAVGGYDVVVALGGDGTVNEVVNGLLTDGPGDDRPALAVVPGGSTNVFARALGLPHSPVEATAVLLDALRLQRTRAVGLGRIHHERRADGPGSGAPAAHRWFTFNAGMGLDARVVRRVDVRRAAGRRASHGLYVRAGLRQLYGRPDARRPTLAVVPSDGPAVPLAVALVCNTSPWTYLGGRAASPCPRASFDLGLDLFGLRRLGRVSTLRHVSQILARDPRPRGRSVVTVHDADQLVLRADTPQPFQIDGEDVGDRTEVVLRSVPFALRVVV